MNKLALSIILSLLILSSAKAQQGKLVPFKKKNGSYVMVDSATMKVAFELELDFATPFSEFGWAAKDQKWGIMDRRGNFILRPTYDELQPISNGVAVVSKDGRSGLLRIDGSLAANLIYTSILITDNFLKVSKTVTTGTEKKETEQWGILDFNGKELIPCQYDEIRRQNSQLYILAREDKIGFASIYGRKITDAKYTDLDFRFHNHMLIVAKNDLYGLIDTFGNEITPFIYNSLYAMPNQRLKRPVEFVGEIYGRTADTITTVLMDSSGREYFRGIGDYVTDISFQGYSVINQNSQLILINKTTSKIIANGMYPEILHIGGGFFAAYQEPNAGVWEIYDLNGIFKGKLKADSLRQCRANLFSAKRNGKWGILNLKNKQVLPFVYDQIDILNDAGIKVCQNNKWGLLNARGKILMPIQYDNINLSNDEFNIILAKKDNKLGLYGLTGNLLGSTFYDDIDDSYTDSSFLIISNEKKFGLISLTGYPITPLEYDNIEDDDLDYGILIVEKAGKFGAIDLRGRVVIPNKYDEIETAYGGFENAFLLAYVRLNGNYGVVQYYGREILPPQFKQEDIGGILGFFYVSEDDSLGYYTDLSGRVYKEM